MKKILEEYKNGKARTLSRKELVQIKGGADDCYSNLDNDFHYCIETDGVIYGVWSDSDSGLCIDKGASYCLA